MHTFFFGRVYIIFGLFAAVISVLVIRTNYQRKVKTVTLSTLRLKLINTVTAPIQPEMETLSTVVSSYKSLDFTWFKVFSKNICVSVYKEQ